MSNIWIPPERSKGGGDAKFRIDLEGSGGDKALYGISDRPRIIIPGEEKLRTAHERYKPWAVGLKIQLTPTGMAWDQEVWFLRAADDNVAGLAHALWDRQAKLEWRQAGNTGERPPFPDTVGRTACVLIDEGDWFEYFKSAETLALKNDKLKLLRLGEQIMDRGKAPMFWCLRGHCFDFKHIFEDDSDQDRLLLPD